MKASEFIKVIEKAIKDYGDLDIVNLVEDQYHINRNLVPQELSELNKKIGYSLYSQKNVIIKFPDGEIFSYTDYIDKTKENFTGDNVFVL